MLQLAHLDNIRSPGMLTYANTPLQIVFTHKHHFKVKRLKAKNAQEKARESMIRREYVSDKKVLGKKKFRVGVGIVKSVWRSLI